MYYREYDPIPALAPFIRQFWVQTAEPWELMPIRIVTDGIVELVFHFGDGFLTSFDHLPSSRQPDCFAIAQMHGPIGIQPLGKVGILGVHFEPWGAHHFMGLPAGAMGADCLPLCELWGPEVGFLQETIATASNHQQRLEALQSFLVGRLARSRQVSGQADAIIRRVCDGKGRATISEIAADLGFSTRSLARHFQNSLGVSPKHFSKIQRFLFACQLIRSGKYKTLTEVAYECAYYDQAHFNHDFSKFAGQTPLEFSRTSQTVFFEV